MTVVVERATGDRVLEALLRSVGPPAAALVEWRELVAVLAALERPPVCTGHPDAWWSTRPELEGQAVEACGWCPVLRPCRRYALAADERAGTWGGTTEAERRVLAGRRR